MRRPPTEYSPQSTDLPTRMTRRLLGVLLVVVVGATACSEAPEPGDVAAFCNLLETGVGLDTTSTSVDYRRLAAVAPPDIRATIETLEARAQDFTALLAAEPPDLEAIFKARFDPAAERERAVLDRYAEDSCGIVVDRPPPTRWNTFVRENHADAVWRDLVTVQFETANDLVLSATAVFDQTPSQMAEVERVCQAVSDFLIVDGAIEADVQVLIGTLEALSYPSAEGVCQLP